MNRLISIVLLVLSITAFLVTHPQIAYAQNITLSVNPPLIETVIKPGKSFLVAYTVSNLGDPTGVKTYVRPFKASNLQGGIVVSEDFSGPIRFSLDNSDIDLEDAFFLNTNKGQQLLLKIRVPEGTPENDYYYSFIAEAQPGTIGGNGSQSTALTRIASNILITVTESANLESSGSINSFKVLSNNAIRIPGLPFVIFESTQSVPIQLIGQNNGKNLLKPSGNIKISGTFGDTKTFEIVPKNILGTSVRLMEATPSASFVKDSTLVLDDFYVGDYSVTANVTFGPGSAVQSQTIHFFALPFKLLFATGIALILGGVIIKQLKSHEDD